MTAEIVSVGTELLLGQIADTDAQYLGQVLPEFGIDCYRRQTVGDNLVRLTEALRLALGRADLVFTIGGLGPTEDDLTREGIAAALEDPLETDEETAEKLRKLFAFRGLPWTESQLRQAMRPACGRTIENRNGSAPGLLCKKGGKTVIALPGPPGEFRPMVDGPLQAILEEHKGTHVLVSRLIRLGGIGESMVEEAIRDLLPGENPTVGIYASPGEVKVRISASAPNRAAARELIRGMETPMVERLGPYVVGFDDDTPESSLIDLLANARKTLATAESCTGGMLGCRLTNVPGVSEVYLGGVVSYANEAKRELLGVAKETLAEHGAVSAETAEAMALGIRERLGSDFGVSITGIAGPAGGSEGKPVGLVFVGLASAKGTSHQKFQFQGTRETIRTRATLAAMQLLREQLTSN